MKWDKLGWNTLHRTFSNNDLLFERVVREEWNEIKIEEDFEKSPLTSKNNFILRNIFYKTKNYYKLSQSKMWFL